MIRRITLSISLIGTIFFLGSYAYAQVAQPNIQTYSTATSSTVIITAPSGYQSEVISTYNNGQFQTFATSTPLTTQDINNIQAQQSSLQQLFQEQEALFQQQEELFQSFWNNFQN